MNKISKHSLGAVMGFALTAKRNCQPLAGHGGALVHDLCEIIECAKALHRLNELDCNVGLIEKQEKKRQFIKDVATATAKRYGWGIKFEHDPRGASIKIQFPDGVCNTVAHDGYAVPY